MEELQDEGKVWGVGEIKCSSRAKNIIFEIHSVDAKNCLTRLDWTQDTKDTNYFVKSF